MSNEQQNPAVEPSNTVNAEGPNNTISQEQFESYVKENGLKVFNDEQFNTLQSNLLKEGMQKNYQNIFGKALDKAKNDLAKKFNLELDQDAKFEDVLNSINPGKGKNDNDKDIEILRNKLLETESKYQSQIAEMQSQYQNKEIESVFNSVWSKIQNRIEIAPDNMDKYKSMYFKDVKNTLDFSGEVVKNGDIEYKDELRNALSKDDAIKDYLLSQLPLKPTNPVKSGNGMSTELSSSNNWLNSINDATQLFQVMQDKGININSPEATKLHADWWIAKNKR